MYKGNVFVMNGFTLRPATETDIPEVLKIEELSFTDPWTEGMFLSSIGENIDFTLLLDGVTPVGYSILDRRVEGEAELHNIAVLPKHRGKGLSALLMDKIVSDIKETDTVFLEVRASNVAAKGLYKKYGFTEIGVRRNYYKSPTEDAVIMQRRAGM